MIRRLKFRFVLLSAVSILVLLSLIVAGMNLINYNTLLAEADDVLSLLSENRGRFPGNTDPEMPHRRPLSPEVPYESRFFSVLLSSSGELLQIDTSRIAAIDSKTAASYAAAVFQSGERCGLSGHFRYLVHSESVDTYRITFLDLGRKLDTFYGFLLASVGMSIAGFCVALLIIIIISGRILRPVIESNQKQQRFITDAGHEIKTPLTIISANADLLELDIGENDRLRDIREQTRRLSTLTGELVSLARMEEAEKQISAVDFPLSDIVVEAIAPFHAPAQTRGITITAEIQPMLSLRGDSESISRLVGILLDNAVKYAPDGGQISVSLLRRGRNLRFSVTNDVEGNISPADLNRVFDRFYRTDLSRNSATGGYGIGLSMAKAIVEKHGGRISADSPAPNRFRITVVFPT